MLSPDYWIKALRAYYPRLTIPTLLYGSQIIYVWTGIKYLSKYIDLHAAEFKPWLFIEVAEEVFGSVRYEGLSIPSLGIKVLKLYVPIGSHLAVFEIFDKSHLGDVTMLMPWLTYVNRDEVNYWVPRLELYLVLEATRPDAPRAVGLARFRDLRHVINWELVIDIANKLNVAEKVKRFIDELS
ncbi:MAG: hypothetical protein QW247_06120 [Pyrobaculum sp.]